MFVSTSEYLQISYQILHKQEKYKNCTYESFISWRGKFTLSSENEPWGKFWKIRTSEFRVTRQVPLVEQELLTLPEHLSSAPVCNGVHVSRSLVLCIIFCRSLFVLLAIVLSVLLRFTDSDYPWLWYLRLTLMLGMVKIMWTKVLLNVSYTKIRFTDVVRKCMVNLLKK